LGTSCLRLIEDVFRPTMTELVVKKNFNKLKMVLIQQPEKIKLMLAPEFELLDNENKYLVQNFTFRCNKTIQNNIVLLAFILSKGYNQNNNWSMQHAA
jgi:hypothetical protein